MLTAQTRIRVKAPLPLPQKATRPPLTGDTKIRLSQIVDLKKWVEDQRQYQLGEISETTGLMKTPDGWVAPPQFGRHQEPPKKGYSRGAGGSKKNSKQESARQHKWEQKHKQTKQGNRSPENNTRLGRPNIFVDEDVLVTSNGRPDGRKIGFLLKGQPVRHRISMARAEGIDCLQRLINTHQRPDPELWSKDQGIGIVEKRPGETSPFTLHFYSYDDKEIYEAKPGRPRKTKK